MNVRNKNGADGNGGRKAGAAGELLVALWVGFLLFEVVVPEAAGQGIETAGGVWLSGVNVGLLLGMGLIVAGMVLAVVRAVWGEG